VKSLSDQWFFLDKNQQAGIKFLHGFDWMVFGAIVDWLIIHDGSCLYSCLLSAACNRVFCLYRRHAVFDVLHRHKESHKKYILR
jgi:hypothetical protein